MAKKKSVADAVDAVGSTTTTEKTKGKGKKGDKALVGKEHKPPADPFGDVLPNASNQGSPADKNWKPKGDPTADIATLEAQERFLYRLMVKAKATRDLAKAKAKLVMAQADETSVTDGFPIEDKRKLHKQADAAEREAAKEDKQYKRAREGWNAVKGTLHRYLTEPEKPLIDAANKARKSA